MFNLASSKNIRPPKKVYEKLAEQLQISPLSSHNKKNASVALVEKDLIFICMIGSIEATKKSPFSSDKQV